MQSGALGDGLLIDGLRKEFMVVEHGAVANTHRTAPHHATVIGARDSFGARGGDRTPVCLFVCVCHCGDGLQRLGRAQSR